MLIDNRFPCAYNVPMVLGLGIGGLAVLYVRLEGSAACVRELGETALFGYRRSSSLVVPLGCDGV